MRNLKVDCTTRDCPHFSSCCRLPTEVNTTIDGSVGMAVIGQGAGWQEEKNHVPWCGKAGQLLREELKKIAIDKQRIGCALSNTVRCRPTEEIDGKLTDRVPTEEEVGFCLPYLLKDLSAIKPKVIVAAGGHAAAAFGISGPVSSNRGKIKHITRQDAQGNTILSTDIIVTYHPAGVLRNPSLRETMVRDLNLAYEFVIEQMKPKDQLTLEFEQTTRDSSTDQRL